jgi:hypothetical protein
MTNTTPDIVVSRTQNGSTYESKQYEITLAAVDRHGMYSWRSTRYFGPGDDEYDQEIHNRRSDAEAVASGHAHAIIDAL